MKPTKCPAKEKQKRWEEKKRKVKIKTTNVTFDLT